VEKVNAENVSGLYLEDAEVVENNQNTQAEPASDGEVTDAPIVESEVASDDKQDVSSDVIELSASGDSYEIFVTCDDKAEIPDGSLLEVQEITPDQAYSISRDSKTYDE
jgi:hypothetical protein